MSIPRAQRLKSKPYNSKSSADLPVFIFEDSWQKKRAGALLPSLPPVSGAPVRIETTIGLHDQTGALHAGAFLRERRIAFNCTRYEFPRVFVHELFHFVWLRVGNPAR